MVKKDGIFLMRVLFSNSFRPSLAVVPIAALLLCFYLCGSVDEIAYDEPDETIELNGNTVKWDLYDSVDLIEGRLYKYELKVEHPKGHVYLDSVYNYRSFSETRRWILVARTNRNVLLASVSTDTASNPIKPGASRYIQDRESVAIAADWLDEWFPFNKNRTVLVKIVSNGSNNYFKLIFPESTRKFYFKQFFK